MGLFKPDYLNAYTMSVRKQRYAAMNESNTVILRFLRANA
jgi:hypothetical protein